MCAVRLYPCTFGSLISSMWFRELSLCILWYVVSRGFPLRILWYVILWFRDLSSTSVGRLVAFLWFVCPFKYLVWTFLCWYVLITFPLWLCLCDISWYFVSHWLMIFVQCMLISYAFDRWYSFQQKLMMSYFFNLYTFRLSICFVIYLFTGLLSSTAFLFLRQVLGWKLGLGEECYRALVDYPMD